MRARKKGGGRSSLGRMLSRDSIDFWPAQCDWWSPWRITLLGISATQAEWTRLFPSTLDDCPCDNKWLFGETRRAFAYRALADPAVYEWMVEKACVCLAGRQSVKRVSSGFDRERVDEKDRPDGTSVLLLLSSCSSPSSHCQNSFPKDFSGIVHQKTPGFKTWSPS